MSRFESTVPVSVNPELFGYLLKRDSGGTTGLVSVVALTQAPIASGWTIDTIGFSYARNPDLGFENRDADGFAVFWQDTDTVAPQHGGIKVSASTTQFSMMWPDGATRSYAVAAFRYSHQGEQLEPTQQAPSWKGVTS